jgi:hypothetical protein
MTTDLIWPLLTSGSSVVHYCTSCHIEIHLHSVSARPPRVRTIAFIPCTRRIYCIGFVQCWTSFCIANSSALIQPHMRFLFIGSELCLRLPSDSTSRWTPLPLANGSHCQAHSGLSPPSYRPCRAHYKKLRPCTQGRSLTALPPSLAHSAHSFKYGKLILPIPVRVITGGKPGSAYHIIQPAAPEGTSGISATKSAFSR